MKNRTSRTLVLTVAVVALAIGGGLLVMTVEADAGTGPPEPCRCGPVFDPVVCNGGRQFPNQCEADCANARSCQPLPGGVFGPNSQ